MKEVQWGRLLGLWAAFLFLLPPVAATFAMLLSLAAVSDLNRRVVPNSMCLAIAFLGGVHMWTDPGSVKWRLLNIAATLFVLFLIKVIFKEGIGMGDIKLLLASSFLMSLFQLALGLIAGCVLAAIVGLVKFRSTKGSMPLVPFLAMGLIISTFL